MQTEEIRLAVIGLGYVGLPLAVEFGKKRDVIGFDINHQRISELKKGNDITRELTSAEIASSMGISFSDDIEELQKSNCFIITVPTPIDNQNSPNLEPLISATQMIGGVLSKGDIVIYESTVYPGATEEVCVPIIEENTNLKFNIDFFVGYSPERINPGDKKHRLVDIVKVTSGSTAEIADLVNELYSSIILAGTHKAESIKVAEAAKVIENTQRDVNIALINELAIIFHKLNIDTEEVLRAAETKWNFLPFKPGLVGGHCIGVDPYYLTHKAQSIGYNPEIILAGRALNDNMSDYVIQELHLKMLEKKISVPSSKALIMGLTFKENCPDLRNSKVLDIVNGLNKIDIIVDSFDPWVHQKLPNINKHFTDVQELGLSEYDSIIISVAHSEFKLIKIDQLKTLCKPNHVIYDLKYIFKKNEVEMRL